MAAGDDMVQADNRQEVTDDLTEFTVVQVTSLDSLATDAVLGVAH